jgi:mannosyl-3-phosphoglycerate synthase
MSREYEETVTSPLDEARAGELRSALQPAGLTLSRGGRFYSVSAPTDKGRAVRALAVLFRRAYGSIRTVGIGDSWNDRSMLSSVDVAFLVQKTGGFWEDMEIRRLEKIEGVGPRAWQRIAERLLDGEDSSRRRP